MHFVPEEGLYVYFRYDKNQTVMCVMNTASDSKRVNFERYKEQLNGFTNATNVLSGESLPLNAAANIAGDEMWVLELKK